MRAKGELEPMSGRGLPAVEAFSVNMRTWFSSSTIRLWAAFSEDSDRLGTFVPQAGQEDAVVER